jgi:hypothetical protein
LAAGLSLVTFAAMRILGLLFSATTCIAGDFVNLTFDGPDLSGPLTPTFPDGPLIGNTAQLLPGWTVTRGGAPQATMFYSPPQTVGAGAVRLFHNTPADAATILGPHSLMLVAPAPEGGEIRLSQQGTIPADAASLGFFGAGAFLAYINGEFQADSRLHNQIDVRPWAGQTVNLEFRVPEFEGGRFDVLGFVPVPEPSTWALFGVGVAAILYIGRRKT